MLVSVFSEVENAMTHFHPKPLVTAMKKLIAVCSMILALGFVAGCPKKAEEPVKSEPSQTGSTDGATEDTTTDSATPAATPDPAQ